MTLTRCIRSVIAFCVRVPACLYFTLYYIPNAQSVYTYRPIPAVPFFPFPNLGTKKPPTNPLPPPPNMKPNPMEKKEKKNKKLITLHNTSW